MSSNGYHVVSGDSNWSDGVTRMATALSFSDDEDGPSLACHFNKFHPVTYSKCRSYVFRTNADVRVHLNRCHSTQPPFCPVCKKANFKSVKSRDRHVRQLSCTPSNVPDPLGMAPDQWDALTKVAADHKDLVQDWFKMWDILFPMAPRPNSHMHECSKFTERFRRKFPKKLANALAEVPKDECVVTAFNDWNAAGVFSNPIVDIQTLVQSFGLECINRAFSNANSVATRLSSSTARSVVATARLPPVEYYQPPQSGTLQQHVVALENNMAPPASQPGLEQAVYGLDISHHQAQQHFHQGRSWYQPYWPQQQQQQGASFTGAAHNRGLSQDDMLREPPDADLDI